MYTLRCTKPILARLREDFAVATEIGQQPTTVLGDWYAKTFNVGRLRLILCTSERSLLTLFVPAKDLRWLPVRLAEAVARALIYLDVNTEHVVEERRQMAELRVGPTASRSVLGTMNDMARMAGYFIRERGPEVDLDEVAEEMNQAPCGPIQYESPDRRSRNLFRPRFLRRDRVVRG